MEIVPLPAAVAAAVAVVVGVVVVAAVVAAAVVAVGVAVMAITTIPATVIIVVTVLAAWVIQPVVVVIATNQARDLYRTPAILNCGIVRTLFSDLTKAKCMFAIKANAFYEGNAFQNYFSLISSFR